MLIVGDGAGFLPQGLGTDFVGSFSAAISAVCHLPAAKKDRGGELALRKVM
jgi:hypothetical protein